jgi:hypothetical protein
MPGKYKRHTERRARLVLQDVEIARVEVGAQRLGLVGEKKQRNIRLSISPGGDVAHDQRFTSVHQ